MEGRPNLVLGNTFDGELLTAWRDDFRACDNESCQSPINGGAPLTVIIDGQMRQFCGLSSSIAFT